MELNELRKTAEAATPGPWECVEGDEAFGVRASVGSLTWDDHSGEVFKKEDAEFIATFNPETVLDLLSRLEQAEARVKLLESGIVADLVITSVHSARAIGATVSGISETLLKFGYGGLTERLEKAEQDRDKLMNRLDAMRRQRDGYRNQLRKTEQQIQRVREVLEDSKANSAVACVGLRALDGDGRG